MGAHDKEFPAIGAHINLPVREHGRRFLREAEGKVPEFLSGRGVEGLQVRPVIDLIDAIAVEERGGISEFYSLNGPLGRLDIAGLRPVDRCNHAERRPVEIFVAMRDDD